MKINLSNLCLLITLLYSGLMNPVYSQVYLDIPIQLDFYRTNSSELDFSRRGVIVNPSFGFTLARFDSSNFLLSNDLGFYYSKLNQIAGDESFHYQRFGIINYNIQVHYDLPIDLSIGVGASLGVYSTVFGRIFNPEVDGTSDREDRLGDGFRSYNVGNFLELRYSVTQEISFGTKYTYWYLPQLKYRTIGELGDLSDYQTDLFTSRLEFSVRYTIV